MSAASEKGDEYLRFLNYLLNDCIYLLDETMKELPKLKAAQARRELPDWHTLHPRSRMQHECVPNSRHHL